MNTRRPPVALLLAGAAVVASLAFGAGAHPVSALGPVSLPSLPVPVPSLPLPSLPLPTLPVPVPSIPLPSASIPPPSLPVPVPSTPPPSLGIELPSPDLGTPSSGPSATPPAGASASPAGTAGRTSDRDDTALGGPTDDVTGGVSGGTRTAPFARPLVLEAPPVPPSVADVGSWLVPGLAVAVPALLVAALVALEILTGAVGVRVAGGGLDRIGSFVPHWLRRSQPGHRSGGAH